MTHNAPHESPNLNDIRDSYDRLAEEYAHRIGDELKDKPLDRELLDRFAAQLEGKGKVAEFGCGPGHVGRYLFDRGVDVFGLDLSLNMIDQAHRMHPQMTFQTGNMLALELEDSSLAGIVAFYAIVNFSSEVLPRIFAEMYRVLRDGGLLFLAFHIGDEKLREEELWGIPIAMDFFLLKISDVTGSLLSLGFALDQVIERDPYPEVEYQSRRAYIFARKIPASNKL